MSVVTGLGVRALGCWADKRAVSEAGQEPIEEIASGAVVHVELACVGVASQVRDVDAVIGAWPELGFEDGVRGPAAMHVEAITLDEGELLVVHVAREVSLHRRCQARMPSAASLVVERSTIEHFAGLAI